MADYVWGIGPNDEMMIRDLGGWVEFWFHSDAGTFNRTQPYSYYANGSTVAGTFNLSSGGAWQHVASVFVSVTQEVGFTIVDEGLGWPTSTRSVLIDRGRPPDPPAPPRLTVISQSIIELDWGGDGLDHGFVIDAREYWGSPDQIPRYVNGYVDNLRWMGLQPGTIYYFWAKSHNRVGWSGFSAPPAWIRTWSVPAPPTVIIFSMLAATSVRASFDPNSDGGRPIDAYQIGYGVNTGAPQTIVSATRPADITGLRGKTTYYFWARAHNSIGWGPWGPRSSIKTYDVPDPPSNPTLSTATQTTVAVTFTANGDNGATITGFEIGYSKSSDTPEEYVTAELSTTVTELEPGTLYYFWTRARNIYGWSALSEPKTIRTRSGAWIKVDGIWQEAVPYVKVEGSWIPAQVWAKIAGVWKETQ